MPRSSRFVPWIVPLLFLAFARETFAYSLKGSHNLGAASTPLRSGRMRPLPRALSSRVSASSPVPKRRAAVCMSLLDDFDRLPAPNVVSAVQQGGRFTAADVSAAGGVALEEARRALTDLCALLGDDASLEVSLDGELVAVLPRGVSGKLAQRSQAAQLQQTWERAKPSVLTAVRVAFGVGLLVSLAAVYSAIFFISTSSSEEDNRRDDRRDSRGGMGGGFGGGFGPSLYYGPSPFDVFYYRPYYSYYDGPSSSQEPPRMGLLESVYSYVFGDGDPNADLGAQATAQAARAVRAAGGAVTAAQLLPFVPEPPTGAVDRDSVIVDEQYVLPVVSALGGVASVDPDGGDILYTFEDVAVTAVEEQALDAWGEGAAGSVGSAFLEERPVAFSAASGFNLFLAGGLGVLNLVGALYLGLQLSALPAGALLPGGYGLIQSFYPLLLAYAVAFNAAPLLRSASLGNRNQAIGDRNDARRRAAAALAAPDREMQAKLAAAARASAAAGGVKTLSGSQEEVAFRSGEGGVDRLRRAKQGDALADFDRRLGSEE